MEAVAEARACDATTLHGELAAARARLVAAEASARLGAADEQRLNRLEAATEELLDGGAVEHQRVRLSIELGVSKFRVRRG